MSRRLPAGNGVVGHDGRDDPGRALGGGALAGVRGRVRLGALHGPADGVVVEPAAPALSFGILGLMVPALVVSLRSRYPFLWLPASQASSARASTISLTRDSAIILNSSERLTMPSSNLGISAPSLAISCILSICGYCLSTNPDFSN